MISIPYILNSVERPAPPANAIFLPCVDDVWHFLYGEVGGAVAA